MKKARNHSVNCQACGFEVLNYQLRPFKVGNLLMDLCPRCVASSEAYDNFKEAALELNRMMKKGQNFSGPDVVIQPVEENIQKAVELLKRYNPNYFSGISKIVAGPSAHYGHTSSNDPTIVNINLSRIKTESKGDKRSLIIAIASTIAHEVGHSKSFDEQKGFVGGESPAESEERSLEQWISQNENRLQDLFK